MLWLVTPPKTYFNVSITNKCLWFITLKCVYMCVCFVWFIADASDFTVVDTLTIPAGTSTDSDIIEIDGFSALQDNLVEMDEIVTLSIVDTTLPSIVIVHSVNVTFSITIIDDGKFVVPIIMMESFHAVCVCTFLTLSPVNFFKYQVLQVSHCQH